MSKDTDIFSNKFAYDVFKSRYSKEGKETWEQMCDRVVNAIGCYSVKQLMLDRKFVFAGRYLYAAGRDFHQVNNCLTLRAEDTREGWADLAYKSSMALMTGAGVGIDYSTIRHEGALIKRTGGVASGPVSLMHMINELGRFIMQGGSRRSAIWAGLNWKHKDIHKFLKAKDWSPDLKLMKEKDFEFPLPLEGTNISVIFDTAFFKAIDKNDERAKSIFVDTMRQAMQTGEPGFSFNFNKDLESLRNACTEVTSEDDSDKCNLGTLWLNNFKTKEEFAEAIPLAVEALIRGGMYSHTPYPKARDIGDKNNRIGLGLGGIHDWLMTRGYGYEVVPELKEWLEIYAEVTEKAAKEISEKIGVPVPKGTRALAPNGTIGILTESSTSGEPLFCKAYKRRYYDKGKRKYQYVVDGLVQRLVAKGVDIDTIQDSYDISFEDRIKFQANIQDYVDMAIASTCNIPAWGSEKNNSGLVMEYAETLLKYAKRLRGFTVYPDGSRGGQPLERVDIDYAMKHKDKVYEDKIVQCQNGVCGV